MGYIIEKLTKGKERWERCNDYLVPLLTYPVKGLEEGKEYQFRVRAENAAGISEPSRITPFVKAVDPIGMNFSFDCLPSILKHIGRFYSPFFHSMLLQRLRKSSLLQTYSLALR